MYPISCLFVQVVVKYKPENLQKRSDKNFEPHYDNLPMQYTEMFFIFKNEKMKKMCICLSCCLTPKSTSMVMLGCCLHFIGLGCPDIQKKMFQV